MIRAPYCFISMEQCREILEGFGCRVRERSYVDEEVPNALLIVFDPTRPIGQEKVAVHSLEDIEFLAQSVSDHFFSKLPPCTLSVSVQNRANGEDMSETAFEQEIIELVNEPGDVLAVHLSRPELNSYTLGDDASFLLRTALFGQNRVELYEMVSGTDRYPPGRIAKVTLSYAELDRLIGEYHKHQAAQQEKERTYREKRAEQAASYASGADDFDPFLDGDDLS